MAEDKKDLAQDKKMIKAAMAKHEKAKHPGQPLTKIMNQRSSGRGG